MPINLNDVREVTEKWLYDYIKFVQYKINSRPRKILNFETPVKIFYELVA
jgi:IS30 family transposase